MPKCHTFIFYLKIKNKNTSTKLAQIEFTKMKIFFAFLDELNRQF